MSYHANLIGSDNKDTDNSAQFYLGICAVLSASSMFARIIHEACFFFLFLLLDILLLSKPLAFRAGFQSRHYHILWTGPYQMIVSTRASTHK